MEFLATLLGVTVDQVIGHQERNSLSDVHFKLLSQFDQKQMLTCSWKKCYWWDLLMSVCIKLCMHLGS